MRERAIRVMDDFAARTGLTSDHPPVRYLWTDAFAVCNWLGLHVETGDGRFLELACGLVDQVHAVLGRHRPDDERSGWISGLDEGKGAAHPTAGGLRIGKARNERGSSEPYHPAEEWERDGQYYHYLTKWIFALARTARVTADETYHRWAVELASTAHDGFFVRTAAGPRLVWKMSIDLSRPLVPSSGHHDPLDGFVTDLVLRATGADALEGPLRDLSRLCVGRSWVTDDPLGVGGLLVDLLRCAQLAALGDDVAGRLVGPLARDARRSLDALAGHSFLRGPPGRRLAFRELGLALGLSAAERLVEGGGAPSSGSELGAIARHIPVGRSIVELWSAEESRRVATWRDHRDISDVMWAACLAPEGFLAL